MNVEVLGHGGPEVADVVIIDCVSLGSEVFDGRWEKAGVVGGNAVDDEADAESLGGLLGDVAVSDFALVREIDDAAQHAGPDAAARCVVTGRADPTVTHRICGATSREAGGDYERAFATDSGAEILDQELMHLMALPRHQLRPCSPMALGDQRAVGVLYGGLRTDGGV